MTEYAKEAIRASIEGRVDGPYDRDLMWKDFVWSEGRQEGRLEERKSRNTEIVNNLLDENMTIEFISRVTGLSSKEILKIKDKSPEVNY